MYKKIKTGIGYTKALAGFITRSGRAPGLPVSVFIEPANVCNLRCPLCAAGSGSLTRPKGRMSFEGFKRIVDRLPSTVYELYLWGQGEPFLAPDFLSMIRYASSKGFRTITSTNGHFLEDPEKLVQSGLDVLIVSLDGIDSDTYTSYRIGGDFKCVVDGIKRTVEKKKQKSCGPTIELQYLVTKENAKDIDAFNSLARTIGADRVVFKTIQAASMENGLSYLPEDIKFTRYRISAEGQYETDRHRFLRNRCLRLYYSLQIDWQGNVLPCCFDKDSRYIMGNVFKESIETIWNSSHYRTFRNMLNKQGRVLPMCGDCTEGLKRKTIHV